MAIPQNKDELIVAIKSSVEKLKNELVILTEAESRSKTMKGHAKDTLISPCDLVAYLIGWGELVLKWHKIKSSGAEPHFPETGFQWNELGRLAQKFYQDYENLNYEDLLKKFNETVEEILALIEQETNEALYGGLWYKKYTMGRMIQFNTSSPYKNAYSRIRKWKREKNR